MTHSLDPSQARSFKCLSRKNREETLPARLPRPCPMTSWGRSKTERSEEGDGGPAPRAARGPGSGRRDRGSELSAATWTVQSPGRGAGLGVWLREKEEKNLQKREAVPGGVGQETERSGGEAAQQALGRAAQPPSASCPEGSSHFTPRGSGRPGGSGKQVTGLQAVSPSTQN